MSDFNAVQRTAIRASGFRGELLGVGGVVAGLTVLGDAILTVVVGLSVVLAYFYMRWGHQLLRKSQRERVEGIVGRLKRSSRIDAALSALAADLQLTPPWRISLYELRGGSWIRLARDSNYPTYRKSGRLAIPESEGILAWAARTGGFTEFIGLPDSAADPDEYVRFQATRGMPTDACRAMNMKSRSYVCIVSRAAADQGQVDVGLVVESEDPGGVSPQLVERIITTHTMRLLHRVSVMGAQIVAVEKAVMEGAFWDSEHSGA